MINAVTYNCLEGLLTFRGCDDISPPIRYIEDIISLKQASKATETTARDLLQKLLDRCIRDVIIDLETSIDYNHKGVISSLDFDRDMERLTAGSHNLKITKYTGEARLRVLISQIRSLDNEVVILTADDGQETKTYTINTNEAISINITTDADYLELSYTSVSDVLSSNLQTCYGIDSCIEKCECRDYCDLSFDSSENRENVGIVFKAVLECSFENLFCENVNFISQLIEKKLRKEFYFEAMVSDRLNALTMFSQDKLEIVAIKEEHDYKKLLNSVAIKLNSQIKQGCCFDCAGFVINESI